LLQLVGKPQRKTLKLKDPEKYEFRPKELLAQIVNIYVNLDRGDSQGVFSRAISSDGRSYRDELFTEALGVLKNLGVLNMQMLEDFEALGAKTRASSQEMMDEEALLGDIPDDFLDPIQYTLMTDPVILPSSKTTIDRSVIQRHLLSDQTDPFNRSLLTADMLIPDIDLKRKIDEYLAMHSKK